MSHNDLIDFVIWNDLKTEVFAYRNGIEKYQFSDVITEIITSFYVLST